MNKVGRNKKDKKTSQYYGVCCAEYRAGCGADKNWSSRFPFHASVRSNGKLLLNKFFATELEAAKAVDMALIRNGEQPRNILKSKQ